MKRKQINITEEQAEDLKALSHVSGISMSEHHRRALDEYLKLHLIRMKDDGTYKITSIELSKMEW